MYCLTADQIQDNIKKVVNQVSEHWRNMEDRAGGSRTRVIEEHHESFRDSDTSYDSSGDGLQITESKKAIVISALRDIGLDNLAKEYSSKYPLK